MTYNEQYLRDRGFVQGGNGQWYKPKAGGRIPDTEQCQRKEALAGSGAGEAPSPKFAVVRFTLCRQKLLDVDAKYASVKDLLDGLAYAGLIHGDKEGQIRLEVEQLKVHKKQERTEIEIIYP